MRDRESVSKELDSKGDKYYTGESNALIFIGRCIKYLADTLYLIHLKEIEANYNPIDALPTCKNNNVNKEVE